MTGAPFTMPAMDPVPATCKCVKPVRVEAPDLCGRFTGRVIRGLNPAAETPQWMRDRLERAGMRHISALVDISNYVMLELGRPTHFFDLAKLEGDHITVRWAREGEKLTLLNGETVDLTPYYGVVCDGDTPSCIAGIMGGDKSGVSESTTDLFIEAAFWHQQAHPGTLPKAQLFDRRRLPLRARRRFRHERAAHGIRHSPCCRDLRHSGNPRGPG